MNAMNNLVNAIAGLGKSAGCYMAFCRMKLARKMVVPLFWSALIASVPAVLVTFVVLARARHATMWDAALFIFPFVLWFILSMTGMRGKLMSNLIRAIDSFSHLGRVICCASLYVSYRDTSNAICCDVCSGTGGECHPICSGTFAGRVIGRLTAHSWADAPRARLNANVMCHSPMKVFVAKSH